MTRKGYQHCLRRPQSKYSPLSGFQGEHTIQLQVLADIQVTSHFCCRCCFDNAHIETAASIEKNILPVRD